MQIFAESILSLVAVLAGITIAFLGPRILENQSSIRALDVGTVASSVTKGAGVLLAVLALGWFGKLIYPVATAIDGKVLRRGYIRTPRKGGSGTPQYFVEIQEGDGNIVRLDIDSETYERLREGQPVHKSAMSLQIQGS